MEQAVDDMRAARAAAGGWDPELLEQQISQVNSQLMQARADHEQAEAELRQIDSLVEARGPEAVFEVVDPQLLVWTNEQLMWLRRTQAELRAGYGADHPAVAEMRDAISQLIEDTSARLIASVRNRVKVSADKVQALEHELRRLVDESIATRRGQAQLRIAEREAKATAELYETLLTRSKETAQTGLEQPDARIISRASVPHRPSYPNRLLLLGVAVLGSIALSGTLVGLAEGMERGYRSSDQLKRSVPLPGPWRDPLGWRTCGSGRAGRAAADRPSWRLCRILANDRPVPRAVWRSYRPRKTLPHYLKRTERGKDDPRHLPCPNHCAARTQGPRGGLRSAASELSHATASQPSSGPQLVFVRSGPHQRRDFRRTALRVSTWSQVVK